MIFYFGGKSAKLPEMCCLHQVSGRRQNIWNDITCEVNRLAGVRQYVTRSVLQRWDFHVLHFQLNQSFSDFSHVTIATNYKHQKAKGAWLAVTAGLRLVVCVAFGGLKRDKRLLGWWRQQQLARHYEGPRNTDMGRFSHPEGERIWTHSSVTASLTLCGATWLTERHYLAQLRSQLLLARMLLLLACGGFLGPM